MKNESKIFFRTRECIEAGKNASLGAIEDAHKYLSLVQGWQGTASKRTHYTDLELWSEPAYEFIRKMLNKYGFINGNPEANAKNPNANFWWQIYCLLSNIVYSPNLVSEVAYHHSSAFERNRALMIELNILLSKLN